MEGRALAPGTVFLLDSIGELASLYALANVAFVGGSLVPRGGHNILEPAQHGVPIVIGPHYENFRDIYPDLRTGGAVRIVVPAESGSGIRATCCQTKIVPATSLGQRAAAVVIESQSGATDRTLQRIEELLAVSR